jgi:hypothetical protein
MSGVTLLIIIYCIDNTAANDDGQTASFFVVCVWCVCVVVVVGCRCCCCESCDKINSQNYWGGFNNCMTLSIIQ